MTFLIDFARAQSQLFQIFYSEREKIQDNNEMNKEKTIYEHIKKFKLIVRGYKKVANIAFMSYEINSSIHFSYIFIKYYNF